jgi:N-acetylmuramoyl-L-alanine amidase/LysM domain
MIQYTVKRGDTLGKIAKKYYGRARKSNLIETANRITDPDALTVGQVLEIPADPNADCTEVGPAPTSRFSMTERPARWSGTRKRGRPIAGLIVHAMPEVVRHQSNEYAAADWLDRQYDVLADGIEHGPKTSMHGLVSPDGSLLWTVPWSHIAYHAGKSRFKHWSGLNGWFLGVGLLVKGCHTSATFEKALQLPGIVPYTDEQYVTLAWVVDQAMRRFGFPRGHVVGHHTVSPGREIDPGPKFSWKRLDTHLTEFQP